MAVTDKPLIVKRDRSPDDDVRLVEELVPVVVVVAMAVVVV